MCSTKTLHHLIANCSFGDAVTTAFSQRFIQLNNVLFYSRPTAEV